MTLHNHYTVHNNNWRLLRTQCSVLYSSVRDFSLSQSLTAHKTSLRSPHSLVLREPTIESNSLFLLALFYLTLIIHNYNYIMLFRVILGNHSHRMIRCELGRGRNFRIKLVTVLSETCYGWFHFRLKTGIMRSN